MSIKYYNHQYAQKILQAATHTVKKKRTGARNIVKFYMKSFSKPLDPLLKKELSNSTSGLNFWVRKYGKFVHSPCGATLNTKFWFMEFFFFLSINKFIRSHFREFLRNSIIEILRKSILSFFYVIFPLKIFEDFQPFWHILHVRNSIRSKKLFKI